MKLFWVVALLIGVAAGGALVYVRAARGFSTRDEPTQVERAITRLAHRYSIPARARAAQNPVPFSDEVRADGLAHFADHCASCHANDGSGQTDLGRNLYPRAPDMRLPDTQQLTDGELYWMIANGVRLTGMPAWGTGADDDEDTWTLVHFIRRLNELTPAEIARMQALNPRNPEEIREELEDERFLSGADIDETSRQPAHGH